MKNEVWNAVNQEMAIESEQMIMKVMTEGEEKCQLLRHERDCVQRQLQERDLQLQSTVDNMEELDHAFVDVAREFNSRHQSEIVQLSEERLTLERENTRLDGENAMIREEVLHLKSCCKSMEHKIIEQEEVIHKLEHRRTETVHRFADAQSCQQLLEKQVEELKLEKASFTKAREQIFQLSAENKEHESKISTLREECAKQINEIENLKVECKQFRRQYAEASELIDTLEQDKCGLAQEMEHRLRQKEVQLHQLTEAVDVMAKRSTEKAEPVVVHLNDHKEQARQMSTGECHHLRSRVLELQRTNYRLEGDLAEAKRECQTRTRVQDIDNNDSASVKQLREESNALKQIVTMMRAEMEKMQPPTNESENEEGMSSSYTLALEQQLVQCRAYLDIFLKSRGVDRNLSDSDDELHFLRSRYKELNDILDQVREENFR